MSSHPSGVIDLASANLNDVADIAAPLWAVVSDQDVFLLLMCCMSDPDWIQSEAVEGRSLGRGSLPETGSRSPGATGASRPPLFGLFDDCSACFLLADSLKSLFTRLRRS